MVLLPQIEIDSSLGIVLLPAELGVVSHGALRQILDRVVLVKHVSIHLGGPVEVHAEGLGISQRNSVVIWSEFGEVVLHVFCCEVIFGDRA